MVTIIAPALDPVVVAFLNRSGWAGANASTVAGDASSRRFLRLRRGAATAILMIDDGPEGGASARFVMVSRWLRAQGISAPDILAEDAEKGLLLVEDLGDRVASGEASRNRDCEEAIYGAAGEMLAHLATRSAPDGLTRLDSGGLGELSALAWEWYAPAFGKAPPDPGAMGRAVSQALASFDRDGLVVSLRDFHAENLLWRADKVGMGRLGLVDFQDAVLAHPVYDLVSLVQDARRDVGAVAGERAIAQFCVGTERDPTTIAGAMAAIGAARALRILGIFARLALRDGKTRYVPMIPRVWAHLTRNLDHPALWALRDAVLSTLPRPDAPILSRLETQEGGHPSAAMIFAAGLGTRMRPLTDRLPKPLIPVAGRPLIDHALGQTKGCGVDQVVVNVHYMAPALLRHLGRVDDRIAVSDETDQLLDTGGGLKRALPLFARKGKPVFTLNSDAVWLGPNPLAVLRAAWDPGRMGAMLLLVPTADMLGYRGTGDFVMDADGRLKRGPGLTYTGAGVINTTAVAGEGGKIFSLNRVWDGLEAKGRLCGTIYPGRLVDVGRPESIALAEAALRGPAS